MDEFKSPRSARVFIERAINKLAQAEDHLRDVVLIGTNPELSHLLFEAQAFIRQAVSSLSKASPSVEN
ncbi:MAG TPA: hypothetical protein VGR71_18370 [Nitrospira sp.]|nr:hypothetical protein [Nitrospira sp.]